MRSAVCRTEFTYRYVCFITFVLAGRVNSENHTYSNLVVLYFTDTSTNEYFNDKNELKVPIDPINSTNNLTTELTTLQLGQQLPNHSKQSDPIDLVDCK